MPPISPLTHGLVLLLPAFGCALAAQQTAYYPPGYSDTVLGDSSASGAPFAAGVARTQMLFESWALRIPNARTISKMTWRRSQPNSSTGYGIQLEMKMGPTDATAAQMATTFDQNWASPPSVVFPRAIYNLPHLGPIESFDVPLGVPYVYDAGKNLVVEFRVFANANANQPFNYFLDAGSNAARPRTTGFGCRNSANQVPQLDQQPVAIGAYWNTSYSQGVASAPVYLAVGGPTTPFSLGFLGAAACTWYVDPANMIVLPGTTNGGGGAQWFFPVEYRPDWYGSELWLQTLQLDLFGPQPVTVSAAVVAPIGTIPPGALVANVGDANATTANTSLPNHGLITRFTHN